MQQVGQASKTILRVDLFIFMENIIIRLNFLIVT